MTNTERKDQIMAEPGNKAEVTTSSQTIAKPLVSGSLLVEIKTLLQKYRDEQMPNWNTPYHYEAEGWAAMRYFILWLERVRQ